MQDFYFMNDLTYYTKKSRILPGDENNRKGALWIGNYESAKETTNLAAHNIRYVVSVMEKGMCKDLDRLYQANGITHLVLDASDVSGYDISKHFPKAIDFIESSIMTGNVLVHCFAGISRSSTVVLAYMMKTMGRPWRECLVLVQKHRSVVNPNHGFQQKLDKLQSA